MKRKLYICGIVLSAALMGVTTASAKDRYLLSDNKFTASDYKVYQDMGVELTDLDTGADYYWEDGSDASIISTDTKNDGQEMTGGLIRNHSGDYVANSQWGENIPSSAIFDLKDTYAVDQVDVWSSSTSNQQLGKIEVSVSNNGVDFTLVGAWQATVPESEEVTSSATGQVMSYTSCQFDAVNARYVKVTAYKATKTAVGNSCYQYILGEIAVMGLDKLDETQTEYKNMYLLSENSLLSGDYQLYDSMGIVLNKLSTGADYQWTEDSDAEMISTDQNGTEMTGGLIKNHDGNHVANSKWQSNTASSAVFDLKDIYTVSRVDVWSTSSSNQQLGEIRISVSSDGISYTDIGTWQATIPPIEEMNSNGQADGYTACEFREINARYVKVSGTRASKTMTGGTCYQYVLGEILIMGSPEKGTKKRAVDLHFTDNSGKRLYSYSGNGTVTSTAYVYNCDASLITGHYNRDGKLKKVSVKQGQYESYDVAYVIEDNMSIDNWEDGDFLKLYVFKSLDNLIPLAKSASLKEIDLTQTGLISGNNSGSALIYPVCEKYDWVETGKQAGGAEFADRENELFDGNTKNTVSSYSDYANLKIGFTEVMQVERVDVYANCAVDSYMSEYDIYASIDGVNYQYVTTKTNTVSKALGRVVRIRADIDITLYAKYIKLVMKKDSDVSGLALAEVEVYGKFPTFEKQRMTQYSYETEVPFKTSDAVISADSMNNMLNDGNTTVTSEDEYISVIYNLGEYMQVEDVTVYGTHSGCELLLSLDGVSYSTAGFYPSVDGVTKAYGKSNSNAKYVKLVFRKGNLHNITLGEIELYARKLYDLTGGTNSTPASVPLKAYLKPNNVLYLDWSGYNHAKNNIKEYRVYIEEANFTSSGGKILKQVYCGGNPSLVSSVEEQSCIYAGLEPDKDYYVAVVPMTASATNTAVTPVKIHTYSALGGEKLAGIFCINEYPSGGGAHVAHEDEASNLQTKLKLITDMEILSKTRYWESTASIFKTYLSRGFGFHQYVRNVDLANSYGIYSFASANEPDLADAYKNNPEAYADVTKANYQTLKNANSKNLLCETSLCGTDKLNWLKAVYEAEPNYGDYYDVVDVHAYCKGFEGKGNYDDNISSTSENYAVPEHIFAKVDKIYNLLEQYNDADKDLIFTETGWSTHTLPYSQEIVAASVTKNQQANFVARCYLVSALAGVKNVFLYAFQDESWETTNKEWQFGIVDWYGNPKPAYYTYYTLGKLLKEAEVVKRIDNLEHPNYGAVFYDNEKDMYLTALWNISGYTKDAAFSSNDTKWLKVDAYGNSEYITSPKVKIGSAPIYIYSTDIPQISVN